MTSSMKNNVLTNSDNHTYSKKKKSQPQTTARQNVSQTHLIQNGYKTPEKLRIFRQKTPSTKVKVSIENIENKENLKRTINKNSSQNVSNRQQQEKQTSNLMKQINQKLNQKSVSVPEILEQMKENNENNQFEQNNFQRGFAQKQIIKIQDLFNQNQITIKEVEKNWQTQQNQKSELIKSLNCSKANLLNSLIPLENSNGHKPLIYVIDLAQL